MKYKFFDSITSDVMFEAYGKDLRELFENSAEALFSVICRIGEVKPVRKEKFEMKAENISDLMINWLSGLIAAVDVEEMFFSRFRVLEIDDAHVIAEVSGEEISREKGGTVVKAVTYHRFKLEKTNGGYKVTVTLDI